MEMTKFKYESSTYMFAMGVIGFEKQNKQKKKTLPTIEEDKNKGNKTEIKTQRVPNLLIMDEVEKISFFPVFLCCFVHLTSK